MTDSTIRADGDEPRRTERGESAERERDESAERERGESAERERRESTERSRYDSRADERDESATDRSSTDRPGVRASAPEHCPECSGRLLSDAERAETVCAECGLVVVTDEIDRGPEWRAFDAGETDEKSRVGAPTTTMMHDQGLSTNIGWQDRDAYGKALSGRQRRRMRRLRIWNERFRTRHSKDRNLKQALGEIDRMASALGLPDPVRETASVIYRRALAADLLPGRSIEGVATAALYAAARQAGTPRSLDELSTVSRVERAEIARTYRYVVRELGLAVEPADPRSYVPRIVSDLNLSDETERTARTLLEAAESEGIHSGKSPVGLAAAAVYAATLLTDERVTQNRVSDVANVSEVTIRNRYHELLETDDAVTA